MLDDVTTASISYTANAIYPADVALYWRVRGEDETGVGLTWSEKRVFRYQLPTPDTSGGVRSGEFIPTWRWKPVTGAVTYDVHVQLPDGTEKDFKGLRAAALTAVKMTGTGVFRWRVRAELPQGHLRHRSRARGRAPCRSRARSAGRWARAPSAAAAASTSRGGRRRASRSTASRSPSGPTSRGSRTTRRPTRRPASRRGSSSAAGRATTLWWRVAALDEDNNRAPGRSRSASALDSSRVTVGGSVVPPPFPSRRGRGNRHSGR